MYVCLCKGISDKTIEAAIKQGADYRCLREQLGVASDCGQCAPSAKAMVKIHKAPQAA